MPRTVADLRALAEQRLVLSQAITAAIAAGAITVDKGWALLARWDALVEVAQAAQRMDALHRAILGSIDSEDTPGGAWEALHAALAALAADQEPIR